MSDFVAAAHDASDGRIRSVSHAALESNRVICCSSSVPAGPGADVENLNHPPGIGGNTGKVGAVEDGALKSVRLQQNLVCLISLEAFG